MQVRTEVIFLTKQSTLHRLKSRALYYEKNYYNFKWHMQWSIDGSKYLLSSVAINYT